MSSPPAREGAVREPAVSVLITSYNRQACLAAAIESVLAQRFTDFELLVVDDASTDGSVEVARRHERDPRVRVVVNEKNLGQFPNRNHAASLARAPLIKFHDSDDLMYPHCLEVMVECLRTEPRADFALSGSRTWNGGPCPMLLTPADSYRREFLGAGMFNLGPACALFRTAFFRATGGFPERGVASDYLFWLAACREARVLLVPGDLFWYRVHGGQELVSPAAARDYAASWGAGWRALEHADCPLGSSELVQARRNWLYILLRSSWRDLRRGRPSLAWFRLRRAELGLRDLLTYLRRPRRDRWAGTPLDPAGEFLVPGWLRPAGTTRPAEPAPAPDEIS